MTDSSLVEHCRAILRASIHEHGHQQAPVRVLPSLTISRLAGARANTIGRLLCDDLNRRLPQDEPPWTLFNENLVKQVLEDHDLPFYLDKFLSEEKRAAMHEIIGELMGTHPPVYDLVRQTMETIFRLASCGHVVLVGRGANYITRSLPSVRHVRLVGSLENRAAHLAARDGLKSDQALQEVRRRDAQRMAFLKAHFGRDGRDPLDYDLTLRTDLLGDESVLAILNELLASSRPKVQGKSPTGADQTQYLRK